MATHGKRRALGQHFLKDTAIARQIAETALTEAKRLGCKTLLEIGPGRGAITRPIFNELPGKGIRQFVICERDRDLAFMWQDAAKGALPAMASGDEIGVHIEEADFLELPDDKWILQPPVAVVSNLPYSAGTAIFTQLAARTDVVPVMVLMFQAEVARRLRAEPGTKEWGRLSVWTQNLWDVKKLVSVSKKCFNPPPEVESEVVVVTRRTSPRIPATLQAPVAELWEPLLKTCFTHRRKMLRSGLPQTGIWRDALVRSGVDETKRPEALSWDDWTRLVESLAQLQQ